MRQLKLNIEDLSVESFATYAEEAHRGTVHGYVYDIAPASMPEGTCVETCTTAYTDPATCCWTCNDDTCISSPCPSGPNDTRCV